MPQGPEILLVEDDRDVREAIAEVLEQEGYMVTAARTGLEALHHLKRGARLPNAILLDLMMPVMDGWEFWSIQQSTADWASVPVIIISADISIAERTQSRSAVACLRKPIDIDELLGLLSQVVTGGGPPPSVTPAAEGTGA